MKNIKEIEQKYDDKYLKPLEGNEELKTGDIVKLLLDIRSFYSSSLTSLLEGLKESLPKETTQEEINKAIYCTAMRLQGANTYCQEVIKLIDSLK